MTHDPLLAYFWHPADPDARIPGMLKVEDQGPVFVESMEILPSNPNGRPTLLHGESTSGFFTLILTSRLPRNSAFAGPKESWFAMYLVEGVHLEGPDYGVRKMHFRMEGLQEWTGFNGATRSYRQVGDGPELAVSIEYTRPPSKHFRFKDIELSFWAAWSMPYGEGEISIKTDSSVVLVSPEAKPISEWFDTYIIPLQRLFQFLTHRRGRIWDVAIFPEEPNLLPHPVRGHRILNNGEAMPLTNSTPQVPTSLTDLEVNDGVAFERWMSMFEENRRSFSAYIDEHFTLDGYFNPQGSFFSAARLLERLRDSERSRSTTQYSSDVMSRLKEVALTAPEPEREPLLRQLDGLALRNSKNSMQLFIAEIQETLEGLNIRTADMDNVVKLFIDTRNDEAHHNPKRMPKAPTVDRLLKLTDFARLLIDIAVLRELGLSTSTIIERLSEDPRVASSRHLVEVTKS
jgi:hypothetical protein